MDLSHLNWRKSSRSSDAGDACVEIAAAPGSIAVRDSKDPGGPVLEISAPEFRRVLEHLRSR